MTYSQATAYLESLKPAGMQMGLERMIGACKALGNPERGYPVIHIAGTNGKGSTARMIAAMLTANGYRTGLYTSPAVTDTRDMILIDGTPISEERFADCISQIADTVDLHISEYECLTTAVFLYFKQEQVDVAVIECCLGGETDATNIIPPPLCAVFTPISLDHTAILGNTLEEIARVKSGIMKSSCDIVCAPSMSPEALGVIFEKASKAGSVVHIPAHNNGSTTTQTGTSFVYADQTVTLILIGAHQHENALTALEVMECLKRRGYRFDILRSLNALERVTMPCRQELISRDPIILLDGAHNPHGIRALCETIKVLGITNATLVIGMLADKDVRSCLEMLTPFFSKIICCTPPDTLRALPAHSLAEIASQLHDQVSITEDPVEAFQIAKKSPTPIVVGGSFYTSSVVRRALTKE